MSKSFERVSINAEYGYRLQLNDIAANLNDYFNSFSVGIDVRDWRPYFSSCNFVTNGRDGIFNQTNVDGQMGAFILVQYYSGICTKALDNL